MRRSFLAAAAALALLAVPAHAAPYGGGQFRYWSFTNGNDLRDYLVYWVPGKFHAQMEIWDYEDGQDQIRPEVGVHLRDRRKSVYSVIWRHERNSERFTFETDQVLAGHWVGRASVSPIVEADSTNWVLSAGADYYWGSYNFMSWTLVRDPRGDDLWVAPMRLRLANEKNDWLQFMVAPATKRSIGWAVDAKKGWARFGIESNSRYDFTDVDNLIFTVGFEVPLESVP